MARFCCCYFFLILLFSCIDHGSMAQGPIKHILHIVGDDFGWNDVAWHNSELLTPNLLSLQKTGITLDRFYTAKECAPSRGSLMTGRYPFHFGYYRNPSDEGAVPLEYTLLPEVLNMNGFRTHAVGKWHLGFKNVSYTPTFRGFETFFGYYHWGEEYYNHSFPPAYQLPSKCVGYDLNNNTMTTLTPVGNISAGIYSTDLFISQILDIVQNHPANQSLYLYAAFQNNHDPYECPSQYSSLYPNITDGDRRNFSGMASALDDAIGTVVNAFKEKGLWNETLLLFHSDNGGELPYPVPTPAFRGGAGNNYPLRGGKFTLWEGGIRVPAFFSGPAIPIDRQGATYDGLMHISDMYPTLCQAVDIMMPTPSGPIGLDGLAVWDEVISGNLSPREYIIHQPLNQYWNGSCDASDLANLFSPSCGVALTRNNFKLIYHYAGDNRTVPLPSENNTFLEVFSSKSFVGDIPEGSPCMTSPCLFDVLADPTESQNIAADLPGVVDEMMAFLVAASLNGYPPVPGSDSSVPSDAECAMVDNSGSWQPWE